MSPSTFSYTSADGTPIASADLRSWLDRVVAGSTADSK
jgi:hypothetical protein